MKKVLVCKESLPAETRVALIPDDIKKLTSRGKAVSTVKSLELTVTIDRHDPTPNVPGNFTEITKMDERDFKRLSNDLNDGFQDLWKDYFK